jgi:Holliday junction resolvase RusA-like endonuclease
MEREVLFRINGNPQSKANSRRAVLFNKKGGGKRAGFIKSERAIDYVTTFKHQCPDLSKGDGLIEGDVLVEVNIWYQSFRSDLDESIILDAMQGLIYKNDRQVKKKIVNHCGVQKLDPHAWIRVVEIGKGKK